MAGYFVLGFGMLVFVLHVPGLVVPVPHRRVGLRFVQRPSNLRLIALPMTAIGVGAILLAPNDGATRWLLFLVGSYQRRYTKPLNPLQGAASAICAGVSRMRQ